MLFGNIGLVSNSAEGNLMCACVLLSFIRPNFFVGLICQASAVMEQPRKNWKRKEEPKYAIQDCFYMLVVHSLHALEGSMALLYAGCSKASCNSSALSLA